MFALRRAGCNLEIVKLILKFKADYNYTDKEGSSLLAPATYHCKNLEVNKFLVQDLGLDVNHRDRLKKKTRLHYAASNNNNDSHYEILKFLQESGADPNAKSNEGNTPLRYLVRYGNLKVVEHFLKHNAEVHAVNNKGQNILFELRSSNSKVEV